MLSLIILRVNNIPLNSFNFFSLLHQNLLGISELDFIGFEDTHGMVFQFGRIAHIVFQKEKFPIDQVYLISQLIYIPFQHIVHIF